MKEQPIPAMETILSPLECPRRYWIFFNVLLKGCNHNNAFWEKVTFDNDGRNQGRFVTQSLEAHCVCLLREHYWSWIYQAIFESGFSLETIEKIKFEYDREDVPLGEGEQLTEVQLNGLWSDQRWIETAQEEATVVSEMSMNELVEIKMEKKFINGRESGYKFEIFKQSDDDDDDNNNVKAQRDLEKRNAAEIIKKARGDNVIVNKVKELKKILDEFVKEERKIDEGHLDEETVMQSRKKAKLNTAKTLRKRTDDVIDISEMDNDSGKKRKRGPTKSKFKNYYETKRMVRKAEESGIRLAWEEAYKFVMNNYPRAKLGTNNSRKESTDEDEDLYLEDRENIMKELQGEDGFDNQLRMYAV